MIGIEAKLPYVEWVDAWVNSEISPVAGTNGNVKLFGEAIDMCLFHITLQKVA